MIGRGFRGFAFVRRSSPTRLTRLDAPAIAWLAAAVLAVASISGASIAHAAAGNVLSEQKISDLAGSFTGTLDDVDRFGSSVAGIGDLDGDTVQDVAVGAVRDDDGGIDRGAVWVLFLDASGTVSSHQKISSTAGNFGGTLDNSDEFGTAVASIGDVDGDLVDDLAVGAIGDDDGGTDRGAVWILFMNSNGTVKSEQKISDTAGNFGGTLDDDDEFGCSLTGLGDLDGDNVPDLVVGAIGDDDGGTDRGAAWVLFLNSNGTVKTFAKISDSTSGFTGSLADGDAFGSSAASFIDLDGDAKQDIAIGAIGDDDGGSARGAVYVFFLDTDGSILGSQKISDLAGGFNGVLDDFDQFGTSLTVVRDLDGSGTDELMVGAQNDDAGGSNRGKVWVLFLDTGGMVTLFRQISDVHGGFGGVLADNDRFGSAVGAVRDVDGDGIADIVVGANGDDDGGSQRGAVWVLFLDGVPGGFCGDLILDPGEDCDDGNITPGDCCDGSCMFEAASSPCENGSVCDGDELCDGAGTCDPGTPLVCDDGMPCTQDTCDPILGCQASSGPATACMFPGKSKFDIKDKSNDNGDLVKWKWLNGDESLLADFGNPVSTTEYAVCIYDESGGVPVLATPAPLIVPPSGFWQAKGTKGFKYKDSAAAASGVKKMALQAGVAGKAKVSFSAKGGSIPMPAPVSGTTFLNQDTNVIVQLINDEGFCWSETYALPATKNKVDLFKDKTP